MALRPEFCVGITEAICPHCSLGFSNDTLAPGVRLLGNKILGVHSKGGGLQNEWGYNMRTLVVWKVG